MFNILILKIISEKPRGQMPQLAALPSPVSYAIESGMLSTLYICIVIDYT